MQLLKFRYTEIILMIIVVVGSNMGSRADTQFVGNVYIDGNLVITNGGGEALVSGDTSAYLRVYGYGTSEVSGAAASIEGFNDGWAESASYGSVIEGCNEGEATVGSLGAGSRIEGYNAGWASVVFPGSKEQGYNLGMRDVIGRGIVIGGYNSSGGDQLASGNGSTIDGYNLGSNLVTGSGSSIEGYTASDAAQISGGTTGEAGGTKTAGMVKSGYTNLASANGAWAVGSDVQATNEYSYVFGDGRRSYRNNSLSVANIDVDTLYGSDGNPIDVASIANAGLTTNAALLTDGTLNDERLSDNVVLFSDYPDLDTDGTDELLLSVCTMTGTLDFSSDIKITGGNNTEIGLYANGQYIGSAVGKSANGYYQGAAIGNGANGANRGGAVGYLANGNEFGVAMGSVANGYNYGAGLGRAANGAGFGNVAIGAFATAGGGTKRIAIGNYVSNSIDYSAALRGTLYLDGGTTIMARTSFGTGPWSNLLDDLPQHTNSVSKTGDLITGSLTVSGAVYMAYVPAQGDIPMGVYTNGAP